MLSARFRSGIRARLFGLVLVTFVPFLLLMGVGFWLHLQEDHRDALDRARIESRLVASRVDDHIRRIEALLIGLSEAISPDPAQTEANDTILRRVKADLPAYVRNIRIYAPDGTNIGTSLNVERTSLFAGDRLYFKAALAGQKLAIGEPVQARSNGLWSIGIARPIEDAEGQVRAVLVVGTYLDHFHEVALAKDQPPGSVVRILNERGIVVARSTGHGEWVGRDQRHLEHVPRHLATREISEMTLWDDGETRITGSTTASTVPWLVSVGLPTEYWVEERLRLKWALLASGAVLLGTLALAWGLSRRIVRPLEQLGQDAARLGSGELGHRTQVRTKDEVGALAETFNQMANALDQRHREAEAEAAERRRLEETERQAKETLSIVIDSSPVAIVCFAPDRRIMVWSRAAEKIFGYTAEEAAGQPYKLVPQGGEAEFEALCEQAMAGETLKDVEVTRARKDGSLLVVRLSGAAMYDATGQVRGIACVMQDVTDRRLAEEELRSTRRLFMEVVECVPSMLLVKDAKEHRFVLVNKAAEELLGVQREELIGRNDHDLVPKEQADFFVARDREVIRSRKALVIEGESLQTARGERLLRTQKIPIIDGGECRYLLVVSEDITDRKKAEQELRRTEEQLRQAQKMEAVGQLTGGLSHDFNNLLGVVIGNLDFLKENAALDEECAEALDESLEAASRGADLNRRLLAFARRQPLQPRKMDVNELVTATAKLLGRTLGGHIDLRLALASDLGAVIVDPAQLESAITNLAVNARDAMPRGGRLTITTANRHLDEDYTSEHPDLRPGDYVVIEVTDTGTGIDPETLKRVFEPFFTTKEVGKGTGLGLSMVFGFMKQSGGHVQVYSEVGAGTTVRLYLPDIAEKSSTGVEPAAHPATPRAEGREVVLAVEDNERLRRILVKQLHELGYEVVEAEAGPPALEILRGDRPIDLLLTDIVMPGGMNGHELAQEAVQLRPDLKVLYTSGFPEAAFGENSELASGEILLSKPYRKSELAQKVRQAFAA
jgi:PAS domain S-box-containing protein